MLHHVNSSGFTRYIKGKIQACLIVSHQKFSNYKHIEKSSFYNIKLIFHTTTVNFANPAQNGKPRKSFDILDPDNLFTRNGRAIQRRTTRKSVWIQEPEPINPLATGLASDNPIERPILVDIQSPTAPVINMKYAIGSILVLASNKWIDNKDQ